MLEANSGEKIEFNVYYIKEHKEQEVIRPDGSKSVIHSVDAKVVVNPTQEELSKQNIEVVSKRTIILEILEVNKVGAKLAMTAYLVGCRIIDGNFVSPVFHIFVRNTEELKRKVMAEVQFYLRTKHLITSRGGS